MKELVIATRNAGKLREIRELLQSTITTISSLADFPEIPDIVEDGDSFEQNALKKACITAQATGKPVVADDSGLCVDILNGRPGIYSARFAGPDASDSDNNTKLLAELAGTSPDGRSAAFRCVLALCFPDGSSRTFSGELKGMILDAPKGSLGFGYDPLFLVREYGKTLAELSPEVKNRISHRGKAFSQLKSYLQEVV